MDVSGRTETGEVYERPGQSLDDFGQALDLRIIRHDLSEKTRDGDCSLGTPAWWLPARDDIVLTDSMNFSPVRVWDVKYNKPLGSIFVALAGDQFAGVGASGHYFGLEQVQDHLVYVAVHEDGRQEVVGVREFSKRFDWVNKSAFATLFNSSE